MLQTQISALAQQQQLLIANAQNETRVVTGLIPGSNPAQYGMQVLDVEGNIRVQVGDLVSGDIGMSVSDPSTNHTTEVLPYYSDFVGPTVTTTSSTFVDPSTPVSVTATLGASGMAIVTLSSYCATSDSNDSACVGVQVDGGTTEQLIVVGAGSSSLAVNVSTIVTFGGGDFGTFTPGEHTFNVQIRGTTSGHTFTFENIYLGVQPI